VSFSYLCSRILSVFIPTTLLCFVCIVITNICRPSLPPSPGCSADTREHQNKNLEKAKEAFNQGNTQEGERLLKMAEGANNCSLCRSALPGSPEESFAYSLRDAKKGIAHAQHAVALKYESGKGTTKNYKEAAKWYKAAAESGHPWSFPCYGRYLQNGKGGISVDFAKAKQMYELSMKCQNPMGYYHMGDLYEKGNGVKKDEKEAARLYRIGAELGFDAAQCSLGNCYDFGTGVTPNPEEALKWYLLSAEQGENTTAMMNTGVTMMKIAQMRSDVSLVPRAFYWLKRAVKLGESDARMIMQQIEDSCKSSCAQCNKSASVVKLTRCAKCKLFHYCGKQCQIAHWKAGHKKDCVKTDIA